jgi:hypothetical protein
MCILGRRAGQMRIWYPCAANCGVVPGAVIAAMADARECFRARG